MNRLLKSVAAIVVCFLVFAKKVPAQQYDTTAIKKILNRQVNDWNSGNMEAFMQGYWNNDSLIFIGKKGPKYGYKATLNSYKKSYPDTATMGKLHFESLQLKRLSSNYFFVIGKWHLQRTAGNVEGYFSLLMRKLKNKWLIIADHSS